MNARTAEVLNRIELIAKKLEMSVEDAISILEGRHPTHCVVQKYKEVKPPVPVVPVENPTVSGPVVASAEPATPPFVASIAADSDEAQGALAAQNQVAAGSAVHNED